MLNTLYRQMMFPESTAFFFIVLVFSSGTGSTEELIKVKETQETKAEGSCVTIACTYKHGNDHKIQLLWFKDPNYDPNKMIYTGTIVYSNTHDRPQSPGYSSRVEFTTGKAEATDYWRCDLKINDLQKSDSGNYSFRIIDSGTRYMSKAVNLTVTDNPCKLNIDPSEMKDSVKEWDEFSVRCSTSDSCPSYPEWILHKPGQEPTRMTPPMNDITHENNEGKKITKLKIKPTWKDDNMIMSCRRADTQDSCLFKNITVPVEYQPKKAEATVRPGYIKEGDSVTFSCTSRGRPNVTMSWFKKGINKTLVEWRLDHVKPGDSGEYYCQAENKHGKVQSNIIRIIVRYGPKDVRVTQAVNISNLKEGDELKLNCSVRDSNPAVHQFNWYLNGSHIMQQTNQILIISQIRQEDKGFYHCNAINSIRTTQSNSLQVSIKYLPHQIKIDGETSVKKGSKVMFNCSADANPPPNSYSWKHTSISESLPLSFSKTTGVLTIDTVTIRHAGTYTCAVTNDIGGNEKSKHVTVLYPPSKPTLTMKSEREYGVISITCTVESFPESNLKVSGPSDLRSMRENKMNISKSGNKVTIYLNARESDAGVYKCTADNSEGTNHTEEELLYAPKNVSVRSEGAQMTRHELTLACNTQSKPTPSYYEWKKIFKGELTTVGRSQKLHFHSLQTADSGQYICIVHNIIGNAKSLPVNIQVKLGGLSVLYQVIFPIILLLILIALAIFLLRRKIIKARLHQQIEGSQNNSRENLAMADAADSSRGRTADLYTTLHSPGPARAQVSSARPASNTQQVYSEITLPQMKQGPQEYEEYSSINYITLDFKRKRELAKRASDDSSSAIYSKVFKNKKSQNSSESELHDYENVSSACAPKPPLTSTDWESDTSEEDEVKYTTVSCTVKPGVREPRKKSSSSSGTTSSEEDRTAYSDIKT